MGAGCLYGARAGVAECVEAHAGPVTGVSCHAAPGALDLSHLYLTCSMDWSVKLWSLKVTYPHSTLSLPTLLYIILLPTLLFLGLERKYDERDRLGFQFWKYFIAGMIVITLSST